MMEKEGPKKSHLQTVPGVRANACGSEEMADPHYVSGLPLHPEAARVMLQVRARSLVRADPHYVSGLPLHPEAARAMLQVRARSFVRAGLVKTMIHKMPRVDPPAGLLSSVLEAVKSTRSRCGCVFIEEYRNFGPSGSCLLRALPRRRCRPLRCSLTA